LISDNYFAARIIDGAIFAEEKNYTELDLVYSSLPPIMFFLIPIVAAFLLLIMYRRKKIYYSHHLITITHFNSALLIFATLMLGINTIFSLNLKLNLFGNNEVFGILGWIENHILIMFFIAYLMIILIKIYQQNDKPLSFIKSIIVCTLSEIIYLFLLYYMINYADEVILFIFSLL